MEPFHQSGYLAQVRRLRALALNAVQRYKITIQSLTFLHHGENTTFRVDAGGGENFLLRIHRRDYHTASGIEEELRWLRRLSDVSDLSIPVPQQSKRGKWLETASAEGVPESRICTLLRWVNGRFARRTLSVGRLKALGRATAELHRAEVQFPVVHRRYWDAAGLVGEKPKFGSLDKLDAASPHEQKLICEGRRVVYRKLRDFETRHQDSQGLVHADLHFGNVLFDVGGVGIIDFDDCGFGFFAYDLAVSLTAIEYYAARQPRDEFSRLSNALLEGYASHARWSDRTVRVLPWLITARKLLTLGWFQSRSDNPRIKRHFRKSVEAAISHLERL